MTQPDESPDLELVTAALRADSADAAIYARVLTESLGESLPPGTVTIERDRSMSDRMKGRPGTVTSITVRLGDRVMSLAVRGGQPSAEICRTSAASSANGLGTTLSSGRSKVSTLRLIGAIAACSHPRSVSAPSATPCLTSSVSGGASPR